MDISNIRYSSGVKIDQLNSSQKLKQMGSNMSSNVPVGVGIGQMMASLVNSAAISNVSN